MHYASIRAAQLGAKLIMWGLSQESTAEIVMLKFRAGMYQVSCFDPTNGGFHNVHHKAGYQDAVDTFNAMLEQHGVCDDDR